MAILLFFAPTIILFPLLRNYYQSINSHPKMPPMQCQCHHPAIILFTYSQRQAQAQGLRGRDDDEEKVGAPGSDKEEGSEREEDKESSSKEEEDSDDETSSRVDQEGVREEARQEGVAAVGQAGEDLHSHRKERKRCRRKRCHRK